MTMTLGAFPAEYDLDITTKIFDGISGAPPQAWAAYFNHSNEQKYTLNITNYSGFGAAPQWKDGENIPLDDALKLGDAAFTMVFYGMGFKVTRKHVEYGQLRLVARWAQSLIRSVLQTYAVTHAAVLNVAFTTTYTQFASKTLCATDHTTSGAGTRSNRLSTGGALTPSNLETLYVQGLNWVNYRGLNDPFYTTRLIVPPALRATAVKIVGSEREPQTMDNDLNAHRGMFSVIVDPFLSSATAYFLQADGHGLLSNEGKAPTPLAYMEDASRSLVHGVEFDFICGPEYPDGMLGSPGA